MINSCFKKIFSKVGVVIMSSVFSCAIIIGLFFGISVLTENRRVIIAEQTATLPSGDPLPTKGTAPTTNLSGVSVYTWTGGGTESDPYIVSTPLDLLRITNAIIYNRHKAYINNKYFRMTADLDLSGIVYNATTQAYSVNNFHFDGNGHTISNVYGNTAGLFGSLRNGSVVHDLNIINSTFDGTNVSNGVGGALAYYVEYAVLYNIVVDNCYIGCETTLSKGGFSGIGRVYYSNLDNIIVRNSLITGKYGNGGIVAGGGYNVFTNCNSENNYIVADTGGFYAGSAGIASNDYEYFIYNCHNSSTVIGSGHSAGIARGSSEKIINCSNSGKIISRNATSGICYAAIEISYCWNTGDIETINPVNGGGASGICSSVSVIHDCYNTGNITQTETNNSGISGIMLDCSNGEVYKLYNAGTITATQRIGGIVSSTYALSLYNVFNIGQIVASGTQSVGAICGDYVRSPHFYSCMNDADVYTGIFNSNYYDENSGNIPGLTALVKTESEMRGEGSLIWNADYAWNFDNDWGIDTTGVINNGLPYIKNENKPTTPLLLDGQNIISQERKTHFAVHPNTDFTNVVVYYKNAIDENYSSTTSWVKMIDDGVYSFYATYEVEGVLQTTETYSVIKDSTAPTAIFSSVVYNIAGEVAKTLLTAEEFSFTVSDNLSPAIRISYKNTNHTTQESIENNPNIVREGNVITILDVEDNWGDWTFTATDGAGNAAIIGYVGFWNNTWLDSIYATTPSGSGTTENDPLLIFTSSELAWLSQNESESPRYVKLMSDIDMSTHIWTGIKRFQGVFDGNGHTITGINTKEVGATTGLYTNVGLFGYAEGGQIEVKNLTIDSSNFTGTSSVSAMISQRSNSIALLIEKCVVGKNVSVNGSSSYIGGYVGRSVGQITINNSKNYANVTSSSSYASGFIASGIAKSVVISSCSNYGNIKAISLCGGVIGGLDTYGPEAVLTISDTYNYGDIEGGSIVGGLCGKVAQPYSNINNCHNFGTITSRGANVGGLFGHFYPNVDKGEYKILNCSNTGDIVSIGTTCYYVGGLVGYGGFSYNRPFEIINCFVECNISGTYYVGGLFGSLEIQRFSNTANLYFTNCHYVGDITISTGTSAIGYSNSGLIGVFNASYMCDSWLGSIIFEDCFIKGNIYAPQLTSSGFISPLMIIKVSPTSPRYIDVVYDVNIHYNYNTTTQEYGTTEANKEYYDDGDDAVNTDFDNWFYIPDLLNGMPVPKSTYWVGEASDQTPNEILQQLTDLGFVKHIA